MDFDGEHIEASLMRISRMSGSAGVVEAILHTIGDLTTALAPVIGSRGVAALYARSVHIARRAHAWLPDESESSTEGLKVLHSTLTEHGDTDNAAAAVAILTSFNALLVSLIGSALATRLLAHVKLVTFTENSEQQASP